MPDLPKLPVEPLPKPLPRPRPKAVKGKRSCPKCGRRLRRSCRWDTANKKNVEEACYCATCDQWYTVDAVTPTLVDYTPIVRETKPLLLARERRDAIFKAEVEKAEAALKPPVIDSLGRVIG